MNTRNRKLAAKKARLKRRKSRQAAQSRRGVLLLVVLSMLTLFLMIGTAYIVTANQFRRANKTFAKADQSIHTPARQELLVNEVLNQLLRDTNNRSSNLRFHSLLRDAYGNDGIMGQVDSCTLDGDGTDVTNGQIIEVRFQSAKTNNFQDFAGNIFSTVDLNQLRDAYNGQILTFLDGDARGQSTRIVGYLDDGTDRIFRVLAFNLADGQPAATDPSSLAGSRIAINGRPYNGTGVGYDLTPANPIKLTALEGIPDNSGNPKYRSVALLPNPVYLETDNILDSDYLTKREIDNLRPIELGQIKQSRGLGGYGGSDESYDAVDFQNMFLAMLPLDAVESVDFGSPSLGTMILPSFHRPALLNYWANHGDFTSDPTDISQSRLGNLDADNVNLAMLRKILLRPNWHDHPNFTGSNPNFANLAPTDYQSKLQQMVYGPWDVDNDNDGVRDSVWVDFGAPVMEGPHGRLVKPMAAVMVLDMDGRLNLNAHGTLDLAGSKPQPPEQSLAGAMSSDLARGEGYGPPEISLHSVIGNRFNSMLTGVQKNDVKYSTDSTTKRYQKNLRGKYGVVGGTYPPAPGKPNSFDVLAQMKTQGLPFLANQLGNYATPPNMHGRYAIGLNDIGHPAYEAITDTLPLNQDMPYDLDLSLQGSRGAQALSDDDPYTMAEAERILRAYDTDSGFLPPRIWELAGEFMTNPNISITDTNELNRWRTLLTTDSYDMPVPGMAMPEWVLLGPDGKPGTIDDNDYENRMGKPPTHGTIVDLLRYRLVARDGLNYNSQPNLLSQQQRDKIQLEVTMLLAPELMEGLRLDLNRPFGNGRDDNNNGVVDEPGELFGVDFGDQIRDYEKSLPSQWQVDNNTASSYPSISNFTDRTTGIYRDDIYRTFVNATPGDFSTQKMLTSAKLQFDLDKSGSIDTTMEVVALHNFRRQLFARDLYVLAMLLADPLPLADVTAPTNEEKELLTIRARKLAQWAINVVDFRDPDNCMTPFEYDIYPFDGWDVDGDITTDADHTNSNNETIGEVLWGCERPDLLITETLAWHDRRTQDTSFEEPSVGLDGLPQEPATTDDENETDYDQVLRPRGAAFVELYNPWPVESAANADTHEIINGVDQGIDLDKFARVPDDYQATSGDSDDGKESPVWRISFYRNARGNSQIPLVDKYLLRFDPDDPAPSPQAIKQTPEINRSVYFGDFDPDFSTDGTAFFNETAIQLKSVASSNYMVVGSGDDFDNNGIYTAPLGDLNPEESETEVRRIELDPSTNRIDFICPPDFVGTNAITPPSNEYGVAIISRPDPKHPGDSLRFTLSEPIYGYPDRIPNFGSLWAPGEGPNNEGWYGYGTEKPSLPYPFDIPLDNQQWVDTVGGVKYKHNPNPFLLTLGTNMFVDQVKKLQKPAYGMLMLQRLANPLLPYNKKTNPYMTVDTSFANLTVFNGRDYSEVIDGDKIGNGKARGNFASAERGWHNKAGKSYELPAENTDTTNNPWASQSAKERINSGAISVGSDHFFNAMPDCTLGYLNAPFATNPDTQLSGTSLQPTPDKPFPWFTWNNRPYVSSNELLLVPFRRSSQLLRTHSTFETLNEKQKKEEQYDGKVYTIDKESNFKDPSFDGPFGHLLNFYRVDDEDGEEGIAGLYRMLDFVHVPSRFVATETWLNPQAFGNPNQSLTGIADPRLNRQPPFNRVSTYREPGRVNLNTIVDSSVWDGGLLHRELQDPTRPWNPHLFPLGSNQPNKYNSSGHTGPYFYNTNDNEDGLLESRRGYVPSNNYNPAPIGELPLENRMLLLDPNTPTFFANPFRSADAGNLVPLNNMQRHSVDCTQLRRTAFNPGGDGQWAKADKDDDKNGIENDISKFDPSKSDDSINQFPLQTSSSTNEYNDASRNPYFRYQPLTRLDNLTTTRSNVFAIWITIGFFEVEELNDSISNATHNTIISRYAGSGKLVDARKNLMFKRVYPEGYMLGQESGSETGDIRRVREFAIIDRTIPVAFEPGKNHNVERAVRLRRRIE